jgi:hypothetical protein
LGFASADHDRRYRLDVAGHSRISREARGIEAVVDRTQTIVSYGLTFHLKHILEGQYGVALLLHNMARNGDLILDRHLATVCRLRYGRISSIDTYISDVNISR